jgi:hypothetical protein
MTNQEYSYQVLTTFLSGLPSLYGVLGIITLLVTAVLFFKVIEIQRHSLALLVSLCLTLIFFTTAFYTGVYEFDENPASLAVYDPTQNEGQCGTAWTRWMKSGYGMGNDCPAGCYRGITLRKQLSMSGFPPWPEHRWELQCLALDD